MVEEQRQVLLENRNKRLLFELMGIRGYRVYRYRGITLEESVLLDIMRPTEFPRLVFVKEFKEERIPMLKDLIELYERNMLRMRDRWHKVFISEKHRENNRPSFIHDSEMKEWAYSFAKKSRRLPFGYKI